MTPAPDADLHSVGKESFNWIVNAVANLAVKKAQKPVKSEFRWASFLGASVPKKAAAKSAAKDAPKKATKKAIKKA